MNILFLTQILPYPPDAGPKFKTWQVLRYLISQGHQVTLISMIREAELPFCQVVREYVTAFYPVMIQRSRLKDIYFLLRSILTGRPFLVERDDRRDIRKLVHRLVSKNEFDAFHADQITMTQFVLPYAKSSRAEFTPGSKKEPMVLFDAHNATWQILERFAAGSSGFKHLLFRIEANRIRHYEAEIIRRFDRILAVSEDDQSALMDAVKMDRRPIPDVEKKFKVIPITVDTQEILPVKRTKEPLNLLTIGTLHYPPNADGIRWFVNDVFPLIREAAPDVMLTIIGRNPPVDFLNLQKMAPDVYHVPGYVPDLTPWFEQAGVVIVPVRVGGGMRVRILEAFARAMPVVTTTIGLEGIEAHHGEHILVADEATKFADAVIQLIHNEALRDQLAVNGRKLVEQIYDFQVVLKKLDEIYPSRKGG